MAMINRPKAMAARPGQPLPNFQTMTADNAPASNSIAG
jgi:hypothetical protein